MALKFGIHVYVWRVGFCCFLGGSLRWKGSRTGCVRFGVLVLVLGLGVARYRDASGWRDTCRLMECNSRRMN